MIKNTISSITILLFFSLIITGCGSPNAKNTDSQTEKNNKSGLELVEINGKPYVPPEAPEVDTLNWIEFKSQNFPFKFKYSPDWGEIKEEKTEGSIGDKVIISFSNDKEDFSLPKFIIKGQFCKKKSLDENEECKNPGFVLDNDLYTLDTYFENNALNHQYFYRWGILEQNKNDLISIKEKLTEDPRLHNYSVNEGFFNEEDKFPIIYAKAIKFNQLQQSHQKDLVILQKFDNLTNNLEKEASYDLMKRIEDITYYRGDDQSLKQLTELDKMVDTIEFMVAE